MGPSEEYTALRNELLVRMRNKFGIQIGYVATCLVGWSTALESDKELLLLPVATLIIVVLGTWFILHEDRAIARISAYLMVAHEVGEGGWEHWLHHLRGPQDSRDTQDGIESTASLVFGRVSRWAPPLFTVGASVSVYAAELSSDGSSTWTELILYPALGLGAIALIVKFTAEAQRQFESRSRNEMIDNLRNWLVKLTEAKR